MKSNRLLSLAAGVFALIAAARAALAGPLMADEIALVVNRHVPESLELAQFYAQARKIPAGRIIQLDLPTVEDVFFDRYERNVTPAVRQFLRENGLEQKVRCLVTFYGVPIRITDHGNNMLDNVELARIRDLHKRVLERLSQIVLEIEKQTAAFDPSFKPFSSEQTLEALSQRADLAGKTLATALEHAPDQQTKEKILAAANQIRTKLSGAVDISDPSPTTAPATAPSPAALAQLLERPFDSASRGALREQSRRYMGIFIYARVLQNQLDYLSATDGTGAAFDSELAMLWAPPYPRAQWQLNPMNVHIRQPNGPRVLMTMRLDASTPQLVRDIIANSITVEQEGLKGQLVVDARGLLPHDDQGGVYPLGAFDERLRHLVSFARSKTDLLIKFDDLPAVLPPNSADNVALYCGWYSVRKFVPSMKFSRGAVGYHVASFEMMTLHNPAETGWVHGLLHSGVVATVGSVGEPYLHSFPPPEDFFPLLLTGKLSLAEVYWSTTTLTSWMQACIGDPLYTPYAKTPKVKPEDLPPVLRTALP